MDTTAPDLTQRLASLYTAIVHDVMRERGLTDFVLPESIRPLFPEHTLAGPAFTITGHIDKTASAQDTLLACTGLLSAAPAGHM